MTVANDLYNWLAEHHPSVAETVPEVLRRRIAEGLALAEQADRIVVAEKAVLADAIKERAL